MSLVRWDPFRDLEEFSKSMNRMFARTVPAPAGREAMTAPDWAPAVDISETNEEYLIKAELPEVKKEDVKVSVDHGVLRLSGERKSEKEEKGKKYHRIERSYGSFMRSFTLPENVDEANVRADFKDGILSVRMMKSPAAKPKSIDIKVG
jgi:HSP20 family protein